MPKRIPRDWTIVEMDLLERLAFKGFVCPEGIEISIVLDAWVIEPERDLTKEIIVDLLDGETPLRHPNGNEEQICVTSIETVDEHVRNVERDLY